VVSLTFWALYPRGKKQPHVPIECEAVWAPAPFWTILKKKKMSGALSTGNGALSDTLLLLMKFVLCFLGTFDKLRRATDSFAMSACLFLCLPICPYGTTRLPWGDFSLI
jgi:hypothetical protein